jgi:hypothetical protein
VTQKLQYQPVINSDGTVAIHESILDNTGTIISASYSPVKLEAISFGELQEMLRLVYRHLSATKPITEEDLEALIYGTESVELDEDFESDNVIDLVDYLAGKR